MPTSDFYLSDDADARLRLELGEPCRSCQHLVVRLSPILDKPIRGCEAAGDNEVLGRILVRLAESGRCDEVIPFELPEAEPAVRSDRKKVEKDEQKPAVETSVIGQFVRVMTGMPKGNNGARRK